jgi:hypothetical protein
MTMNLEEAEGGRELPGHVFDEFNRSWMTYWDAYVVLQNQMYESIKAARAVSWLAASDSAKISEINQIQRDLFASMPRKMDYEPLGDISRNLDSAFGKLETLRTALSLQKEMCKRLEEATRILEERAKMTEEALARGDASTAQKAKLPQGQAPTVSGTP